MTAARLRAPAFLAMESLWLYVAVALLVASAERPQTPSLFAVAGALFAGYGAAWFAQRLDVDEGTARAIGLGLGLVALAAILRMEYASDLALWRPGVVGDLLKHPGDVADAYPGGLTGGIAIAGVWARGAWLARRTERAVAPEAASFIVGLGVVGIGLAAAGAADTGAARLVALPFGGLGFVALALARAELAPSSEGGGLPRWWALTLGGGLLAAMAVAALLALLPWTELRDPMAATGEGIGWVAGWTLLILLTPVFFVMEWIARGIITLLEAAGADFETRGDLGELRDSIRDEQDAGSFFPAWVGATIRWGAVGVAGGAALWGLSLLFRRGRRSEHVAPERTSLWSASSGRRGGRWLDRFRRGGDERPEAGAIGRLYGELLDESARTGLARPRHRTPLEFAPDAAAHLDAPVAGPISDAFARARYGALHPSDDELASLKRAWRARRDAGAGR